MAVVSLYDYSGKMVEPWANNGYDCYCLDIKHSGVSTDTSQSGNIVKIEADLRNESPTEIITENGCSSENLDIIFAFPPCTNLAVSGARWFKQKGLSGLSDAIELVEVATKYCGKNDVPYMIENPVSTLSTYWREPDYTLHPYQYDGYTVEDDSYSKKTCLWTGNGFVMPDADASETYDDRIHKMAPSEDRSERRSMTPKGFAKAVYHANN